MSRYFGFKMQVMTVVPLVTVDWLSLESNIGILKQMRKTVMKTNEKMSRGLVKMIRALCGTVTPTTLSKETRTNTQTERSGNKYRRYVLNMQWNFVAVKTLLPLTYLNQLSHVP